MVIFRYNTYLIEIIFPQIFSCILANLLVRMAHQGLTPEEIDQTLADLEEVPSDVGSENSDIDLDPHFNSDFEVEFEQEEQIITLELAEDAATIFHREDSDRPGRNTLASQGRHLSVPDFTFPDPQPRATSIFPDIDVTPRPSTSREQDPPVSYIFPDMDVTSRPSTSRGQDPPAGVFAYISSAGSTDEMSSVGNTPTGNTSKRRRLSRPAPGVAI